MNTTIELETMLENKHGRLLANKNWHVFTIEAKDSKAFLESIFKRLDILQELIDDNEKTPSENIREEFIQYYSAMTMIWTGDLIYKHANRWDPIMATIMKEADDQDIPDDPMVRAMFSLKFLSKIMMEHEAK